MKLPEITIKISYSDKVKKSELTTLQTSRDVYDALKTVYDADIVDWTESFILLCLNRRNKVIGWYKVSHGGTAGTTVDLKVIFTIVLNCPGTQGIILSHNHPSGNLEPSTADISLTKKIKEFAVLLDMRILDHLIYTTEGYYSFADEGLI